MTSINDYNRLVCRWRGHKLPRRVSALTHPEYIVETMRASSRGSGGVCYPIPCKRCGHPVKPMDKGYPMIVESDREEACETY